MEHQFKPLVTPGRVRPIRQNSHGILGGLVNACYVPCSALVPLRVGRPLRIDRETPHRPAQGHPPLFCDMTPSPRTGWVERKGTWDRMDLTPTPPLPRHQSISHLHSHLHDTLTRRQTSLRLPAPFDVRHFTARHTRPSRSLHPHVHYTPKQPEPDRSLPAPSTQSRKPPPPSSSTSTFDRHVRQLHLHDRRPRGRADRPRRRVHHQPSGHHGRHRRTGPHRQVG